MQFSVHVRRQSRYVVLACAFMGAMIGNIQAFIIYPFANAFYRLSSSRT